MAWTYSGAPFADPAAPSTPRDSVRFLIGDTDANDQQMQDAEITGLLNQNNGDVYQAAMQACVSLAAKYARKANKTVGDLSIQYQAISKSYADLRALISSQAGRHSVPTPYAGGISQADMDIDHEDDDLVQPSFSVGQMDDPGTTPDLDPFVRANP